MISPLGRRDGRVWLKAADSKSVVHREVDRGFESLSLRQGIGGKWNLIDGEMPEMAEGARLEIVCAPKRCTEGSNPSLSAMNP